MRGDDNARVSLLTTSTFSGSVLKHFYSDLLHERGKNHAVKLDAIIQKSYRFVHFPVPPFPPSLSPSPVPFSPLCFFPLHNENEEKEAVDAEDLEHRIPSVIEEETKHEE